MSMEGRGNNCEFGGGGLTDASLEGGGVTIVSLKGKG